AADGSVRFLDLGSGRLRKASGPHDAPVRSARFTPDGRTLVTAAEDAEVTLWNVASARATETFAGHADLVREVAVSPASKTVYTASMDGTVIAWDLAGTRRLGRPFRAVPIAPGGQVSALTPDAGKVPPSMIATTRDGSKFAIPRSDGYVNL